MDRFRESARRRRTSVAAFDLAALSVVRGASLAVAVFAASPAEADGCNFNDVVNAIENTVSSLSSGACGAACAEGGAGCIAAAGIGAALGGVAASQGQGSVDNFCSQLSTGVGDVSAIQSWLQAAGVGADLLSDISKSRRRPCGQRCAMRLRPRTGGRPVEQRSGLLSYRRDLRIAAGSRLRRLRLHAAAAGRRRLRRDRLRQRYPPRDPRVTPRRTERLVTDLRTGWDGHSQYCSPQHYCFCPSPMKLSQPQPDYRFSGAILGHVSRRPNTTAHGPIHASARKARMRRRSRARWLRSASATRPGSPPYRRSSRASIRPARSAQFR